MSSSECGSDKISFQKGAADGGSQVVDDSEFVKMYDRTTSKTLNKSHNSGADTASSVQNDHQATHKWKVGDQCMALYEADGKWYPAKIEEFSCAKKTCTVSYIGYDQKAVLKIEDILTEAELAANYSQHSTDLSRYFHTFQPILFSEQIPPTKRRRLSIQQPNMKSSSSTEKEKHTASDYSKISNLAIEKGVTVNLYLEGIQERLRPNIESDVEAADDVANEREAEGTSAATNNKNARSESEKKEAFPIPDLCPPPPPSLFGKIAVAGNEKEALTNMLMSWYMSGYHTGFYQGVMHEKMSHQKPK